MINEVYQREWDDRFSKLAWGQYPSEGMVRLLYRYFLNEREKGKAFLDLGCGPGANNAWVVAREGLLPTAIDFSSVAVERAKKRFEGDNLQGSFFCGGVTSLPFSNGTFDCIADSECLTCLNETQFLVALMEIARVLKPEGVFISLTAKEGSWGDKSGPQVDGTTIEYATEGPYARVGPIRFASSQNLQQSFKLAGLKIVEMEIAARSMQNQKHVVENWLCVAQKPA